MNKLRTRRARLPGEGDHASRARESAKLVASPGWLARHQRSFEGHGNEVYCTSNSSSSVSPGAVGHAAGIQIPGLPPNLKRPGRARNYVLRYPVCNAVPYDPWRENGIWSWDAGLRAVSPVDHPGAP